MQNEVIPSAKQGQKKLITVDADKTTKHFIQIEHKQNQAAQQRNA